MRLIHAERGALSAFYAGNKFPLLLTSAGAAAHFCERCFQALAGHLLSAANKG